KKSHLYIAIGIVIVALGAFVFLQYNKRSIIRKSIGSSVAKKSDSLYYLKYDSSVIDEVNGNASFFNVLLQSDSLQSRIAERDSSDNIIYRVRVKEISVQGANVGGLVSGNKISARLIEIINPDILVTMIGKKESQPFTTKDSLAIYEKILGNFKSIQAGKILLKGGTLNFARKNDLPHATLNNINISITNFKIDSTKDYANLVSYFIKDVHASAQSLIKHNAQGTITLDNIVYDASARLLNIGSFKQNNKAGKPLTELHNIRISGLATNTFINEQELFANELASSGGRITLYKKATKEIDIELDSTQFYKAGINKISIGKTQVVLYNKSALTAPPEIIDNLSFLATDIPELKSGNTFKNILVNSKWILKGDGYTFFTKDKLYKISLGAFKIDKGLSEVAISKISMIPQISETQFMARRRLQGDYYELQFNNVNVTGVDINLLSRNGDLVGQEISLEPVIKVYRDLTLPQDTAVKVAYPNHALQKLKSIVDIKRARFTNGYVSYRERGAISKQVGQIFFDKLSGSIVNVSNKNKADMILAADAKFMGVSNFTTQWMIPFNTQPFSVKGKLGAIDPTVLNAALEPQGMASVKRGNIYSYDFQIKGSGYNAITVSKLVYDQLKIELLKKNNYKNELEKKSALSFLANILIKDANPPNGSRIISGDYTREISKSFFNLLWKSMFVSLQKTITGRSNVK
ncbi:MAG: hypothetical protein ABIP80_01680, partial [Ferruginibacter sp.]